MRLKFLPILFLFFGGLLQAQDIHFTQFYLAPLSFNPAMTGAYPGSYRVGGIYRDQWASVLDNQFITPSIYADAPLEGFNGRDWFGAGLALVNDKAGSVGLTNTSIMGSAAYHMMIGSSGDTYISVGAQGGWVQRRFNPADGEYEDELLNPGSNSADLTNFVDNTSFMDVSAGFAVTSKLNDRMRMNLGASMLHITSPENSMITGSEYKLPARIVVHGQFDLGLTDRLTLIPSILFQKIEGANEMAIQTRLGYDLDQKKEIQLMLGTGYRIRDAVEAMLGVNYKGINLGLAYDFNISDLKSASANRGGFEIGAFWIGKLYRKPKVEEKQLCPRF